MRWDLGVAVAVLVLSAGCAAKPTPASGAEAEPPTPFDPATGTIRGAVFTDEAVPLRKAQVLLLETKAVTETDESGAFSFANVEPGTKHLVAQSLGYVTGTVAVEVRAGEVASARLILHPVQVAEPYERFAVFEGYWSCAVIGYGIVQCPVGQDAAYKNQFFYKLDANYSANLWEVTWKPSSAVTHPSKTVVSFYTRLPGVKEVYYHGQFKAGPPARLLARPGGEPPDPAKNPYPPNVEETSIYAHPFGYVEQGQYGVGVVYQQRFQVYVSAFYHKDMPDKFTSIPDQ